MSIHSSKQLAARLACILVAGLTFSVATSLLAGPPAASDEAPMEEAVSAPASESEPAREISTLELVMASGVIGFIIMGAGIGATVYAVCTVRDLDRERLIPEDLISTVENALYEGNSEEALLCCQEDGSLLAHVLAAGLEKADYGPDCMQEAMLESTDVETGSLRQQIGIVGLVASIAPMLGLLGTVAGMIAAFGRLAALDNADPRALAEGIMLALMTTLLGLVVSVPATAITFFLRSRMRHIDAMVSVVRSAVLDHFRPIAHGV